MENKEKLQEIFVRLFHCKAEEIGEDTSMDTLEEWDSLNHLKLVLAIEDVFGVSLTEEESVEDLSYPLIVEVWKDHGIEV